MVRLLCELHGRVFASLTCCSPSDCRVEKTFTHHVTEDGMYSLIFAVCASVGTKVGFQVPAMVGYTGLAFAETLLYESCARVNVNV